MSVDEFLVWAEGRDGRYELDGGRIVAMSPERARHAELKGAIYLALQLACRVAPVPCRALPDGMTVRIDARTAYEPDALVYRGPRLPGDAIEVPEPVVVVEVLSPGTSRRDTTVKLAGYFTLPSLVHYLVLDPDAGLLIHHRRSGEAVIETRILQGGPLRLDPPGLALDLADIFLAEEPEPPP